MGDNMRVVNVVFARQTAAAIALSAAVAACSRSENKTTDSAAGNVGAAGTAIDTGMSNAATPMAGGTAQITPTDEKSVEHATEYKLTDANFRQFIAASDSLVALRRRDPAVREMFDKQVSDAGVNTATSTMNAGRKRLEDNPAINNAIASTGMSSKDYFVAAIAVAQAERFMANPKAAPPTPALPANAEFLHQHKAELTELRTLERGAGGSATPVTTEAPATEASTPAKP
ncbi:MAG TPA: hypothetical protein VF461_02280 [Gemmatimonadaceae bacterium]